jgi:cytochrome P450
MNLAHCSSHALRTIIALTSVRYVKEDVTIMDKYLLHKGSVVQMASSVINSDPEIWGAGAAEFKADRFLGPRESGDDSGAPNSTDDKVALPLPPSVPSTASRAFGGGSVICPGRHFALSEIVGLTALVLVGFEVESENGGMIELPVRDDVRIPLMPMKPVKDVYVEIRRREGMESVVWAVEL